jgi:hypothetical protein
LHRVTIKAFSIPRVIRRLSPTTKHWAFSMTSALAAFKVVRDGKSVYVEVDIDVRVV